MTSITDTIHKNGSGVIAREVAEKEFHKWLDFMDISHDEREDTKNNIGIVVRAIQNGNVVVNDDHTITQKLKFPFGAEVKVTELKYKTALTVGDVEQSKTNIDPKIDRREMIGNLAAATGEPGTVIMKMNTKDFNISAALIIFFMV